jgi:hypothetical protein
MNSFDYHSNVITDHISVEVQNDNLFYSDMFDTPPQMDEYDLFNTDPFLSALDVSGTCNLTDLKGRIRYILMKIKFHMQIQ